MKSEWKFASLSDVCSKITDGSHFSPPSVDAGEYMVSVKDFTTYGFDFSSCRKISRLDYETLVRNGCIAEYNDVLIGKDGARYLEDIILYRQTERPALLSSIAILKANNEVIPEFLYYRLLDKSFRKQIRENLGSGSAIPRMVLKDFRRIPFSYPPIDDQKRITQALSCLDDKISNNIKINHHLEQMAQAIFKSWFVDFAPFTDSNFIDSELGEIPAGWRVGLLSELINIKYGKDHKKLADGAIPVFGSGGVMRYVDTALYSGESVLIPRKGTLNNVIYVTQPFWSVDTMFYTEMRRPNLAKFVYFFVRSKNLVSMNAGSAVPSMTTEILNALPVVIPPDSEFARYEEVVGAQFRQIQANQAESENLAAIRDSLLPRLMSGELSVADLSDAR